MLDPPHVVFKLKEIFGDYVIPCPKVDADKVTPEEINDLFNRGAKGIKFIAPAKSYGCDDYFPLYDVINQHKGLAVFHTGYVALKNFEPGGIYERDIYVDITDMRPAAIDRIARKFPDLKILMAHFGNPWWEEAWKIISSHKNVHADFSGGTAMTRSMNMWREMFAPNGSLDTNALNKLCFGTDGQSFVPGQYGGDRIHKFYDQFFDELKVPSEIQERINRQNMIDLIGL